MTAWLTCGFAFGFGVSTGIVIGWTLCGIVSDFFSGNSPKT